MSIREGYEALIAASDELDKEREELEQQLAPHVKAWTEFCEEFEKEIGVGREVWYKLGGWPTGNRSGLAHSARAVSYELQFREVWMRDSFQFSGEDYDGDPVSFALPWSFIDNPEETKARFREKWKTNWDKNLQQAKALELQKEREQYEKLRAKFEGTSA